MNWERNAVIHNINFREGYNANLFIYCSCYPDIWFRGTPEREKADFLYRLDDGNLHVCMLLPVLSSDRRSDEISYGI